ncbi:MAG: DUF3426 domain-containing protein [Desulfobacca sp.]|nr:DUF3426 domain-containing protein [Desulfobacca sp.]
MIVTCEKCQTRFHLDEDRIKGDSAKVRCSRCQHVFEVTKETIEDSDLLAYLKEASDIAIEEPDESAESPTAETESPSISFAAPESLPRARPRPGWFSQRWLPVAGGLLLIILAGFWGYAHFISGPDTSVQDDSRSTPNQTQISPIPSPPSSAPVTTPPSEEVLKDINFVEYGELYRGLKDPSGQRLLVLGGKVRNEGEQPRGPILFKATLTDARQKPVMERFFYGGTTLRAEEVLELKPEQINKWLDTPGGREASQPVLPPGEIQPFTVVFFGVPADLSGGYTLNVVSAPINPTPIPDKP